MRRLLTRYGPNPAVLLGAEVLAFWPVWRWLAARWGDGSEEPWGLVALATAVAFLWLAPAPSRVVRAAWLLPALLLLCYTAGYGFLPPLLRGTIAVTALAATASVLRLGRRLHPGLSGLMLLSLPVVASLQFYVGYPLRVAVAHAAAPLLRLSGPAVFPEGACLRWAGGLVVIDAPCSGVKMLWAALFLATALPCFRRLTPRATVLSAAAAVAAAFAGNVLRSAALFYPEAGMVPAPAWAHAGIGIVVFAMVAAAIVRLVGMMPTEPLPAATPAPAARDWESPIGHAAQVVLPAACALAALAPLWAPVPAVAASVRFPGWPTQLEGRPLRELPRSERERRFERGFPGRIARFTDGRREIVIRWVARPTRALHPSADCFRGLGYRIAPLPAWVDARGRRWGSFTASRGGEALTLRERIEDATGRNWSDVSAWYWPAALGRSAGPWWAFTVATRT